MAGMPDIIVEIPISARNQWFTVTLNGIYYRWHVYWVVPAACWVADIYDIEENKILCGIPFITGTDLFWQFPDLIQGNLIVISDQLPPDTVPDFVHLGITGHVYYAPPQ